MRIRSSVGKTMFLGGISGFVLMVTSSLVLGQETALQKIGVFDVQRVMVESEAGQEAMALLNQLADQRGSELTAQQDEINTMRQQASSATAGTAEAAQLERQMEDRVLQYQRLEQDVQQELAQRQNQLIEPISQMLMQVVETFGREEGYLLILSREPAVLLYADTTIDVTEELIRRVNVVHAGSQ